MRSVKLIDDKAIDTFIFLLEEEVRKGDALPEVYSTLRELYCERISRREERCDVHIGGR